MLLSWKATVSVMVGPPVWPGATVAVNVGPEPNVEGLELELTDVVVVAIIAIFSER
jgi:hypothetical protein